MSNKKGWAWDQAIHLPRAQYRTTGKQEGTQPKRLKGKRKTMSNLNDQMRKWRDSLDCGDYKEVRQAAREILAQLQHHLENPEPEVEVDTAAADMTAAHYLEVCAKLDALTRTLEEWEKAKKKTIAVSALRDILGGKA